MRDIHFSLLAGGILNNKPKALIKTPSNNSIIKEILNILENINFNEYNLNPKSITIMYAKNFYNEFEQESKGYNLKEAGNTLTETILKYLNNINIQENEYIFFIATDTPLITQESLKDIILRFSLLQGDIFYPFVSKEIYSVQFGKKLAKRRTFVKLKNDSFCGTGILIIKKSILTQNLNKIKEILQNKKNPLKIINTLKLDPKIIIKIILGKLSVLELEKHIQKTLNIKPQGLLTNYAELAFNIDTPQDLEDYNQLIKNTINKPNNE